MRAAGTGQVALGPAAGEPDFEAGGLDGRRGRWLGRLHGEQLGTPDTGGLLFHIDSGVTWASPNCEPRSRAAIATDV